MVLAAELRREFSKVVVVKEPLSDLRLLGNSTKNCDKIGMTPFHDRRAPLYTAKEWAIGSTHFHFH